MYWAKDPVACLRTDTITRHAPSFQHKQAVWKENVRLFSERNGGIAQAFQCEVSLQREALTKAMKTLYFLAKEEMAHTTKFSSLVDFARDHLGCDVFSHLSQGENATYTSERILQELLQVMADQLQAEHSRLLAGSTYFGLQVDETTDITTTKELVLLTRLITGGEVINRFAGMVEVDDGKANTISSAILAWIQKKGLDVQKLMGLGSDGAPVMTGKRNGVATLLKGQSKHLVAIHCIAHRLALAAGQAGEAVAYFRNKFKQNLGELFRFYDNSACRMSRLHQIQDMLDIIRTTMKNAVDTRWLSHDEACKALHKSLPVVLLSLDHEAKDNVTAFGLLAWLKDYRTLATLYLLCDLLPHLSALSRCFQHAKINLLQIHSNVQTTVALVRTMREGMNGSRLSKLEQDLLAGGRLAEFSISMSPELKLKWQKEVREPFIDRLLQNLQDRFDSTQLLSSFAILDSSLMPQPMPEDYGSAEDEWYSLREYIRQNNGLSQEQLVKLLLTEDTMAELYPSMRLLASVLMVIPVSTADSEGAFSTLKRVKARLRSRMTNKTLNALLTISIDGPSVNDFDFDRAVSAWGAMRNRRISV
ncbi:zinc finger protein 862-like [Sparus aurata]|uniref:zinc finger protein 862-like n=1 Tax=Sparus aurata TaxID=8175 RepID=UPI0011C0D80A|nr:zinc finger protein 862-like [Sparus aurata]